jgi:L-threonylcarbamoyladenylate synthase
MRIIRVDAAAPRAAEVAQAAEIMRAGGVVAYPTDTLYGLAVDPFSDDAVERLFAAKGRDRSAAVPLVAATIDQALTAGAFGAREIRLAAAFWPGPLAIVVPARGALSRALLGGGSTIAIRVPAHPVARALAAAFGACITATSANVSGASPATTAVEAAALGDRVDAVVDAGAAPGGPASTIVQLADDGPRLVRAGAVAWERVLESLE